MSSPALLLVFDVESIGLHGEGFAVGWVAVRPGAKFGEAGWFCCPPEKARGEDANRRWVAENVPPMAITHADPREVRSAFWAKWLEWKAQGAVLVADCCWPVEARFLAACVDDDPAAREWEGPYPLHDLASVLLAVGRDPLATNERLTNELPAHHPTADALQSARLLLAALNPKENPMSVASTIAGLMPLVKSAADVIASFTGTAEQASKSSVITDAAEVIAAVSPLVDSFSRGMEVTPEDVRAALAGMDDALDAFDAEIARQGG